MSFLINFLGAVMKVCYNLVGNYGVAIILFTLLSKIFLLPLSILVHKNSIKMVKIQPKVNRIHIDFFGDKDTIAEKETALYKQEKYRPLLSIIPLIIQIILLMSLVEIIGHPETYTSADSLNFLGFDLSWVTVQTGGIAILTPILAGLSSLVLCVAQNRMNVLQREQSFWNQYGMLILSVGLSLYLGTFVAAGVALYWITSNLFAVLQQWLLNIFINPEENIDYEALRSTEAELDNLRQITKLGKRTRAQIKKERQDYKRFFSIDNKHLVFYSESSGYYKYFKGIIRYLLENTNLIIHYVTSDYNDQVFTIAKDYPALKPYYIGEKKLITLMLKMDADIVVMTMPDLNRFHIKRSIVKKDINYIFMPHGMGSDITIRYKATDDYDTIFVASKSQKEEALKTNELHGLTNREIIACGYPLLDEMLVDYQAQKPKGNKRPVVLIAPSWQKDNIIDLCLDELLGQLGKSKYQVIVRPHPQHIRHRRKKFEDLEKHYSNNPNIIIQTDFSSNDTIWNADLMITDWSDIAFEYAYVTKRPVLFIDTPMKVMNPNYQELGIEPFNAWVREEIGKIVKPDDLNDIIKDIEQMLESKQKYQADITKSLNNNTYHLGTSSEFAARYIVNNLKRIIKERKT